MKFLSRGVGCLKSFGRHTGGSNACISRTRELHAAGGRDQSSLSFDSMMSEGRHQAGNTILVEVEDRHRIPELCQLCHQHGALKKVYYFTNKSQKCQVLVEFADHRSITDLLKQSRHTYSEAGFPVWSRLLKLVPSSKSSPASTATPVDIDTISHPSTEQVLGILGQSESVSEQMVDFYECERLHDLELRLGFLVCKQVEEFISGIYPSGFILPFGSLVNGFGRHSCDIDMVYYTPQTNENKGNLYFQEKQQLVNDRTLVQRVLETLGDLLHYLVPGVSQVHRILRARVPIVKFQHDITDLECDLTLNNLSGVHMSSILHFYSQMDPRVCPLIYTVRKWASASGVTDKVPGTWITNFQLTLMVLFHLQTKGIVPPIKSLRGKQGGKPIAEWSFSAGSKKKPTKQVQESPSPNAEELLVSFFEYYSSFDFKSKGISPYTGQVQEKPEYSPIHIQNPLDRQLNATRNVGASDLRKLQACMSDALWTLEKANRKVVSKETPWGICAIFAPLKTRDNKQVQYMQRKFQVQELFQESEMRPSDEGYVVEATASGVKNKG